MDRARASGIALIQNFESRLQRDILAVEAAVTERWSNGPVEGQVNRLKTIKRQMYGRAGVELLRARLIPLSRRADRLATGVSQNLAQSTAATAITRRDRVAREIRCMLPEQRVRRSYSYIRSRSTDGLAS